MLYAILLLSRRDFVGSWTKEQDAGGHAETVRVQDKLTKQGAGSVRGAAVADTSATTLRRTIRRWCWTAPLPRPRRLLGSTRRSARISTGARCRPRSRRGQSRWLLRNPPSRGPESGEHRDVTDTAWIDPR